MLELLMPACLQNYLFYFCYLFYLFLFFIFMLYASCFRFYVSDGSLGFVVLGQTYGLRVMLSGFWILKSCVLGSLTSVVNSGYAFRISGWDFGFRISGFFLC